MTLGPPPLAHSLATWLLAPAVRHHSLIARARGIAVSARLTSLRRRLALYNLCVALAPTSYMAAAAFTAATRQVSFSQLLTTTLVFLAGVMVFALLLAVLLSSTVTGPVAEMSSVVRDIIRRGDVSRVGRIPLFEADEVGALAESTNQMIDRLEVARAEKAAATDSLAALNRELELRVEQRTTELRARTADMRLVLDNVNEGFFTIDRSGAISPEHSSTLTGWFGSPEPGEAFHQYLGRQAQQFGLDTQLAWDQVIDGLLPLELALEQMPRRLVCGDRQYDACYQAIGEAERFLVVVSDRTADIEYQKAQRERRETLALFEHMLADRSGFVGFMHEAAELMRQILSPGECDLDETQRAIHTLKGNALLFGVESVSELCHEIESLMAQERPEPDAQLLARLSQRWSRLQAEVDGLLGERQNILEVSPEQHAEVEHAARHGAPRDTLVSLLVALRLEPVERRLNHFAEQARQLAQRLDKQIHVEILHDGLRVDPVHWAKFWAALVHAVRNAVDHGIEAPSVRQELGKPKVGRLQLRAQRDPMQLVFEVEDDGQGVLWEAVRERCLSRGLPAATREDLVSALFASGLSTARQATAVSGRGIGMGALLAAVEELEGKLEVLSETQRGTRLRMLFPIAMAAPETPRRALQPPALLPSSATSSSAGA
jgi:two-component system chemotaxis sensor kinase CheA